MKHVLSALVMNQPGVLAHISGMLASRAYNIESLAVGATENPELSRITFVVNEDEKKLNQVRKQLVHASRRSDQALTPSRFCMIGLVVVYCR